MSDLDILDGAGKTPPTDEADLYKSGIYCLWMLLRQILVKMLLSLY